MFFTICRMFFRTFEKQKDFSIISTKKSRHSIKKCRDFLFYKLSAVFTKCFQLFLHCIWNVEQAPSSRRKADRKGW